MKALAAAFLKAQQEFPVITPDATNPHFRSRYATLAAVQAATFPILARHGLIVLQEASSEPAAQGMIARVAVTLYHVESGESVSHELAMPAKDGTPQAVGSAITYGRRYALMTLLGVAPDDDDGNGASGAQRPAPAATTPTVRPQATAPATPPQQGNSAQTSPPARPAWKTPGEAIDAGEALGVFRSHQHARHAFSEIARTVSGREGFTAEQLPQILDLWAADLARRQSKMQLQPAA